MGIESREQFEHGGEIPRTHVIIRDDTNGGPPHQARHVLINGQEVLVAEHGIEIDFGPEEATTVTLKILPATIVFE